MKLNNVVIDYDDASISQANMVKMENKILLVSR